MQLSPPAAALPPAVAPQAKPEPQARRTPRRAPRQPGPVAAQPKLPLPGPPVLAPPSVQSAPAPEAEPPMDMTTMLNAARERRRAAEGSAARENADAAAASRAPSANDIARANVQHSLRTQSGLNDGAGGVFEILSKGTRTAQFLFRGWEAGARNNWRETIDVDAGLNGDVDRAIVRRMIVLIRSHYSGDFNWDSHRLGRIVVLSARLNDNAELEAFLMREFFEN